MSKVKVKIITSFVCLDGMFGKNTDTMEKETAERYERDGLLEILEPEIIKKCNKRRTKAIIPKQNKGN